MYRDDKRRKYGKGICYENIIHEKYLSCYQGYGNKKYLSYYQGLRGEKYFNFYKWSGMKNI